MRAPDRVVVIGLDAMDAGIALRLVDAGRMPTLASLLDTSAWGPTITPPGLVVGGIWPSIATGCWPSRHGFYCDRQLVTHTYEIRRFSPADIQVAPFWERCSADGRRCTVVDVPITQSSDPLSGRQLVEWGAHDRIVPLSSTPPTFAAEVVARFGEYPVQPHCGAYAIRGDFAGLRRDLLDGIARKTELAERLLTEDRSDLTFVVFGESHCAGHQFWQLHDPEHPKHDSQLRAELGDVLEEVYTRLDAALGRVVAVVPDDATLVVLMSHGIGPHYDGDHVLAEVLKRIDEADRPRPRSVVVRERVLRWLGRRRRVARGAVAIDGSHRFVKMPNNELYGAIRINLVGREPRGRVRPGAEFDEVVALLDAELRALTDPVSGRPLVHQVVRTTDWYDGPLLDSLPDLLVDWYRDAPIHGARSATVGTIRAEYDGVRSGDHRPGGLVLVRGPGAVPGRRAEPVPVIDLAPTIAGWLGVDLPGVDGVVNAAIGGGFATPARTARPPARQARGAAG